MKIKLCCPCGKLVTPVETMDHATHVHNRYCPKCATRWIVVISCIKMDNGDGVRLEKIEWNRGSVR